MSRLIDRSKGKRPTRRRGIALPIKVYAAPELLHRIDDAREKSGIRLSRSGLVCSLLDAWAAARGC